MSDAHPLCELCGEPMPHGEEMFKIHGYSGPCPKPPLPTQDDYVAWCRYTGRSIVTCDSDAEGAFRVYRHADSADRTELQHRINFLEQNETVVWEALKIPDGSTIHNVYAAIYKLHARIAELTKELSDRTIECGRADALRDGVKALAEQLEQIVCVVPPDDGVVLLSNEGPVHYDAEQQCNVYDHEHFSPLGDALIAMHDKLTALLGEKGE